MLNQRRSAAEIKSGISRLGIIRNSEKEAQVKIICIIGSSVSSAQFNMGVE